MYWTGESQPEELYLELKASVTSGTPESTAFSDIEDFTDTKVVGCFVFEPGES